MMKGKNKQINKQMKNSKKAKVSNSARIGNLNVQSLGSAPVSLGYNLKSNALSSLKIHNAEIISAIGSIGSGFNVSYDFTMNPGLLGWLGPIASRFECYKFSRIIFKYIPAVSTATAGSVILFWDPDSKDLEPDDIGSIMSNRYAGMSSVWQNNTINVVDKRVLAPNGLHFTRNSALANPYDIRLYDTGRLHVYTSGVATASNIGHVLVEYDVELYDPQIESPLGGRFDATEYYDSGTSKYISNPTKTGRMTVKRAQATAEQVADGAPSGQYVYNLEGGLKDLVFTLTTNGTGITSGADILVGSGINKVELIELINGAATTLLQQFKIGKQTDANSTNTWFVPKYDNTDHATLVSTILAEAFSNYATYNA